MTSIHEPPFHGLDEDTALRAILAGTSAATGEQFFEALVKNLAQALGTHAASVEEYFEESQRLRLLAFWMEEKLLWQGFEYEVQGTPCEPVISERTIFHFPDNVQALFPNNVALKEIGAASYMGVPLLDVDGKVLGALAVVDKRPLPKEPRGMALMRIFADRAAAELQRLRAEAALREREERLRAIGNALPDIVFVIDAEGYYVEILTSQENLLHLAADKLKGRRFHDVFPQPVAGRFLKLVEDTLATGQSQILEYELNVPAGQRWFEGRTAPFHLKNNGKSCVIVAARDITDRKRAEELQHQNIYLQEELRTRLNFGEIVGASEAMQAVFKSMAMVATTDASVLLLGETGTGKELIARAIHQASQRKDRVMIKVNCGALPSGLVESELFGHEKGAFTGATAQKKGRFELAHRGTIFLDEVGELPADTQVKLLRVLQEQEFERVGGAETLKVNVRVIAATNRDLQEDVHRGAFRADLFYRLNIFPIVIPPLRDRKEDIPAMANYFIAEFARRLGKSISGINQKALEKLQRYDWPGNVRELANILERAVILCQGRILQEEQLRGFGGRKPATVESITLKEAERSHIVQTLEKTGGVIGGSKGAAKLLGLPRTTLISRMKKLGIEHGEKPA